MSLPKCKALGSNIRRCGRYCPLRRCANYHFGAFLVTVQANKLKYTQFELQSDLNSYRRLGNAGRTGPVYKFCPKSYFLQKFKCTNHILTFHIVITGQVSLFTYCFSLLYISIIMMVYNYTFPRMSYTTVVHVLVQQGY